MSFKFDSNYNEIRIEKEIRKLISENSQRVHNLFREEAIEILQNQVEDVIEKIDDKVDDLVEKYNKYFEENNINYKVSYEIDESHSWEKGDFPSNYLEVRVEKTETCDFEDLTLRLSDGHDGGNGGTEWIYWNFIQDFEREIKKLLGEISYFIEDETNVEIE